MVFIQHGRGHLLAELRQIEQLTPITGAGSAEESVDVLRATLVCLAPTNDQADNRAVVVALATAHDAVSNTVIRTHQPDARFAQQVVLSNQALYRICRCNLIQAICFEGFFPCPLEIIPDGRIHV